MPDKQQVIDAIIQQGMLPLYYHRSKQVTVEVARTLYSAGIRIIEYTNRGEAALKNFRILKTVQESEMPGMIIGAGTIRSSKQANDFVEAGAEFIVAPIVNPEVAAVAAKNSMVWIPGCMTPTEIHTAQHFGAQLIKIFPANILGPGFVSAVKELFSGQLFMPTGGVELEQKNITAWFKSGVCAVGLGSKLISAEVMDTANYDKLYNDTLTAMRLVIAGR
ncbi:bifunctional 4-hydroxy-2-oxoglutarate aldolase/2-dehydro-3-deoxy-phosphogluconate aldolase [Mucilaginibacter ginkgonis]|uniref:Bifunctional 4-hydroxy-2-oxoglutarate aldolase/2-dehydro-3-deoxy-phosphogluconate aldolase n=1 Tax=Mucilaginibacter ginkgonis TaxID=2682091 RepID=A0A6I4HTM5_9SPHI|nr:bifunctional 4-hydroxy-2-oxoglutarate aldolase/2-dehydro-3-deoxy-phosphogluconate aldolase [Mucilaginibacter ginkgonis]QQL50438.1 bifunctional 4-hydroxy-2-oxoglutarate aldolase/2-dehydro-3-deoxy-phosphogluconate aldolase [Mucilaginibacter ginkgonis]